MDISFVGSYASTHNATSAQSIALSNLRDAAGVQPTLQRGDMVVVAVENASTVDRSVGGGADVLVPSGYTGVDSHNYRDDSNDSNFRVSYKFMGSSPDTTVSIPASNATTAGVAYDIHVFRGVDPDNPLDVAAVLTNGNNTGVANAAAITPVTAGAWIAVFAGAAVAAGAVFTNPSGMSATTNHFRSATITTTTNDANIGAALKTDWASGAFDPAAFGGSTSTNTGSWSAATIALRPAVAPSMTSTNSASVAENATLSKTLTANQTGCTFAITGGADAAEFEISGSTLRWTGNGTKDYETPTDSGANNVYDVQVTPTNPTTGLAGSAQAIAVTVTNVLVVINSSNTASVAENSTLSKSLTTIGGTPTWTIVGGADAAKFEISGSTLRWAGNGTKNYESPDDADSNNQYIVTVRATVGAEYNEQTITVTVTDVAPPIATTWSPTTDTPTITPTEPADTMVKALNKDALSSLAIVGGTNAADFYLGLDVGDVWTVYTVDADQTAGTSTIQIEDTTLGASGTESARIDTLSITVSGVTAQPWGFATVI